eukprot:TRINITY_DN3229_c0_g1_i1.p1 TRINITY_DN3229_c0_g1~~TRINITY_DN3229_c0_g1_i1.p1  ORF type:complete len:250 (-),score=41.53 TRINITY_DN3229_c0_g1_i1:140-889(-)
MCIRDRVSTQSTGAHPTMATACVLLVLLFFSIAHLIRSEDILLAEELDESGPNYSKFEMYSNTSEFYPNEIFILTFTISHNYTKLQLRSGLGLTWHYNSSQIEILNINDIMENTAIRAYGDSFDCVAKSRLEYFTFIIRILDTPFYLEYNVTLYGCPKSSKCMTGPNNYSYGRLFSLGGNNPDDGGSAIDGNADFETGGDETDSDEWKIIVGVVLGVLGLIIIIVAIVIVVLFLLKKDPNSKVSGAVSV